MVCVESIFSCAMVMRPVRFSDVHLFIASAVCDRFSALSSWHALSFPHVDAPQSICVFKVRRASGSDRITTSWIALLRLFGSPSVRDLVVVLSISFLATFGLPR